MAMAKKSTKELAIELGLIRRRPIKNLFQKIIKKTEQCYRYLLIMDFESTCWENDKYRPQEIIEFPAVLMNTSNGAIESEFQFYVQPQEHPTLSSFCKQLTGISQEQVEEGIPLSLCIKKFNHWLEKCEREKNIMFVKSEFVPSGVNAATVVTWSDWDLSVCLFYEAKRKQIRTSYQLDSWIDLRSTYRKFYGRKPNGLNGALQDVGIKFEGREHSGLADSRNTACLAWKMIRDGCIMQITRSLTSGKISSNCFNQPTLTQLKTKQKIKRETDLLKENPSKKPKCGKSPDKQYCQNKSKGLSERSINVKSGHSDNITLQSKQKQCDQIGSLPFLNSVKTNINTKTKCSFVPSGHTSDKNGNNNNMSRLSNHNIESCHFVPPNSTNQNENVLNLQAYSISNQVKGTIAPPDNHINLLIRSSLGDTKSLNMAVTQQKQKRDIKNAARSQHFTSPVGDQGRVSAVGDQGRVSSVVDQGQIAAVADQGQLAAVADQGQVISTSDNFNLDHKSNKSNTSDKVFTSEINDLKTNTKHVHVVKKPCDRTQDVMTNNTVISSYPKNNKTIRYNPYCSLNNISNKVFKPHASTVKSSYGSTIKNQPCSSSSTSSAGGQGAQIKTDSNIVCRTFQQSNPTITTTISNTNRACGQINLADSNFNSSTDSVQINTTNRQTNKSIDNFNTTNGQTKTCNGITNGPGHTKTSNGNTNINTTNQQIHQPNYQPKTNSNIHHKLNITNGQTKTINQNNNNCKSIDQFNTTSGKINRTNIINRTNVNPTSGQFNRTNINPISGQFNRTNVNPISGQFNGTNVNPISGQFNRTNANPTSVQFNRTNNNPTIGQFNRTNTNPTSGQFNRTNNNPTIGQFNRTNTNPTSGQFNRTNGQGNSAISHQNTRNIQTTLLTYGNTSRHRTRSLPEMRATAPLCECGKRSKRRIVQNPGPNNGRFFFSCSVGSMYSKTGCTFFQWEKKLDVNKMSFSFTNIKHKA